MLINTCPKWHIVGYQRPEQSKYCIRKNNLLIEPIYRNLHPGRNERIAGLGNFLKYAFQTGPCRWMRLAVCNAIMLALWRENSPLAANGKIRG